MFALTAICPHCRQVTRMRLISTSDEGTLWRCLCWWGCQREIEGHTFLYPPLEHKIIEEHTNVQLLDNQDKGPVQSPGRYWP